MSEITTPHELFIHELGDILYVEQQLASEGAARADRARSPTTSSARLSRNHLEQTQTPRLQRGAGCSHFLGESSEDGGLPRVRGPHGRNTRRWSRRRPTDLIDIVDLGAAARTENYEIAAYETLRRMAKALGHEEAVVLLNENLKEEKDALHIVERIATRVSKEKAAATV